MMFDAQSEPNSDVIALIWKESERAIGVRIDVLEEAAGALLDGCLDDPLRRRTLTEAHRLAGCVGSFGYRRASRLAHEIARLFEASHSLTRAHALQFSEMVVELRRRVQGGPDAEVETAAANGGGPPLQPVPTSVYVVGGEAEHVQRIEAAGAEAGFGFVRFATVRAFKESLHLATQGIVLLMLEATRLTDARALLHTLAESTNPLPVIAVLEHDSLPDASELSGLGALFVLPAATPEQVAAALRNAKDLVQSKRVRILSVDDDSLILTMVRLVLEARGMEVVSHEDASNFWDDLSRANPDLLVLDLNMPGLDGLDLCRRLRRDPRWQKLPVFILTGHDDPKMVTSIYEAGADDYISKSTLLDLLALRVEQRLESRGLEQRFARMDGLTGAMNAAYAKESLERLLALADEQQMPLTLALFEVDDLRRINEEQGPAAGDEVMRHVGQVLLAQFRAYDVVARWGGAEFLVAMFGHDAAHARARALGALTAVRRQKLRLDGLDRTVTVSAGLASFPVDGRHVATLAAAAQGARQMAGQGGDGARSASQADSAEWYDVVVVEDPLADVVADGLTECGYRWRHLRTGREAQELLCDQARGTARLVLLDLKLSDLDGHALLRLLREQGCLERVRVITLAERSEGAQSMELGAFDHVDTPFSLPVLLHRVRRALL